MPRAAAAAAAAAVKKQQEVPTTVSPAATMAPAALAPVSLPARLVTAGPSSKAIPAFLTKLFKCVAFRLRAAEASAAPAQPQPRMLTERRPQHGQRPVDRQPDPLERRWDQLHRYAAALRSAGPR